MNYENLFAYAVYLATQRRDPPAEEEIIELFAQLVRAARRKLH
ncbi:hypothetical protein RE432_14950 [Pusillimonas sp. SM2304]|nr:hypothetical protein [Pusillimonas sp. SM2304]MDS1141737.1 hypothetical protein [Pusillimonas sp. SM2304]